MFEFQSLLFAADPLLQAIADDVPAVNGTLTRISRLPLLTSAGPSVTNSKDPAVAKVQLALLDWDPNCLPRFGADGDYGSEAEAAVRRFKVQELGVSEAPDLIGDVDPPTVQRLDEIRAAVELAAEQAKNHPSHGQLAGRGVFGRLFPELDAFEPDDQLLLALGETMREPVPNPETQFNNPAVPTGFTFFGQFVDHDITFDRTPDIQRRADPGAAVNFRTPKYDLDSVYGDGPQLSPLLYDPQDLDKLRLDRADGPEDLPRVAGVATIGDPRNDENLIICQLQIAFIKFHNAIVDLLRSLGLPAAGIFEEARRLTQWHYQWIVVKDYLPKIVGPEVVDSILTPESPPVVLRFYEPQENPFMPVEFSGAAYRFGHSQVRPFYRLNAHGPTAIFESQAGEENLNGGRPLTDRLKIDWTNFFAIPGASDQPQHSRLIDTRISQPLFDLPTSVVKADETPRIDSLVERNLRRGKALGLPSGQDVAREMQAKGAPISHVFTNDELGISPDPGWQDGAPLWFYILKEAELQHEGAQLGDVGGHIVAEVFAGLLAADPSSFLSLQPGFRPAPPIAPATGKFTMGDLLLFAGATARPQPQN